MGRAAWTRWGNGMILMGASGTEYFYTLYAFSRARWHADPANYAFVFQDDTEQWRVAYIGETESLFHRMRAHSRWNAAKKLGCAHVLVKLTTGGIRERRAEERDLIAKYRPPLNTQHLGLPRERQANLLKEMAADIGL